MAGRQTEEPGPSDTEAAPLTAKSGAPIARAQQVGTDVNKLDRFLARSEEILGTFDNSIRAFKGQTLQIKTLAASIQYIKVQLKRRSPNNTDEPLRKTPRADTTPVDITSSEAEFSDECESAVSDHESIMDVDDIMAGPSDPSTSKDDELIAEVLQFCEVESDVHLTIQEPVAKMINTSLRCTKLNPKKVDDLKDQYKRPANVDCLQVPKVDAFLWGQLPNRVKSADVIKQNFIGDLNQVAGPLVKAMDHCHNNPATDMKLLKQSIGDCFKFICGAVTKLNSERRNAIKAELDPKFKSFCMNNPISATNLLGDDLPDQSKQLEAAKDINMTKKVSFLGHGRGGQAKGGNKSHMTFAKGKNTKPPHFSRKHKPNQNKPELQQGYDEKYYPKSGYSGKKSGKNSYYHKHRQY